MLVRTGHFPCEGRGSDWSRGEKFSRVHAPTNTSSITGDQYVVLLYTWKPLIILSIVCTSMMIGHATAVHYMYMCASWIWRFVKLKPAKISI